MDTSADEAALRADGYGVPQLVRAFLAEFGGLELRCQHGGMPDAATMEPAEAAAGVFPVWVKYWGERVGEELCPIGIAYWRHMTLTMGASGRAFAGFDETLDALGAGDQCLETLCAGLTPEPVALPEQTK